MSPVEHAFENLLNRYLEYEEGQEDWIDKWHRTEENWCFPYMTKEEIDAVQECTLYVLDNIFGWNKEKFRKIYKGE